MPCITHLHAALNTGLTKCVYSQVLTCESSGTRTDLITEVAGCLVLNTPSDFSRTGWALSERSAGEILQVLFCRKLMMATCVFDLFREKQMYLGIYFVAYRTVKQPRRKYCRNRI